MMKNSGIDYADLITMLLEGAVARQQANILALQ